jgi:hypothetical protein
MENTMQHPPEEGGSPPEDGLGGRVARLPVGIVIRRQPGVTRWARWAWRPVALLPGAGPADWHEMRREGEVVEYHAATLTLEVHRALTEGYRVALAGDPPSAYVVLHPVPGARGVEVHRITASAFEAQDHLDNAEEIVEPVPMPPQLIAWLSAFVGRHHRDRPFVKRRRGPAEQAAGGAADQARIRGPGDVFRAPTAGRRRTE